MFPNSSPQKRKPSEYHDPDYPTGRPRENDDEPSTSKRLRAESNNATTAATSAVFPPDSRVQRIREIIAREMQREITLKHEQLEQIDERLAQARHLLDRVRYAVVSEYYRKQELPLSQADALAVRGSNTLFEEEAAGPQLALHPSLKKIMGKKPRNIAEIMRSCPERAAAQNAKHTIRARSQAELRKERRLQQLIREQGIVIDHSKEGANTTTAGEEALNAMQTVATVPPRANSNDVVSRLQAPTAGKALNATRLNNKTKHVIVIGNSSKYIGNESDYEQERKPNGQVLSHKWLVYVQSKDANIPLESYVKKVRFFLHTSYRPNDIVDISAPPFQLARRGWGEFPLRIQLFFHEQLQQKPVQLEHNLVLDKTLSGLHTLGAETLAEIWLRSPQTLRVDSPRAMASVQQEINTGPIEPTPPQRESKLRTISFTQNKEELEDNLFDFLNKVEGVPDIEKIQPTVLVTEPLAHIAGTSPIKMPARSPIKKRELFTPTKAPPPSHKMLTTPQCSVPALTMITPAPTLSTQSPQQAKTLTSLATTTAKTATTVRVSTPNVILTTPPAILHIQQANSAASNGGLKNAPLAPSIKSTSRVQTIFLPAVAKPPALAVNTAVSAAITGLNPVSVNGAPKTVYQKKLVQLVDATGKVKFLQMLVATTNTQTSSASTLSKARLVPTVSLATQAKVHLVTKTTQSTNTTTNPIVMESSSNVIKLKSNNLLNKSNTLTSVPNTTTTTVAGNIITSVNTTPLATKPIKTTASVPKNVVFQKEGKLYFIDPLQMKLKQQQKKQVSLLKPQVSLLKQQQQPQLQPQSSNTPTLTSGDHDYAPAPAPAATTTTPTVVITNTSSSITNKPVKNITMPAADAIAKRASASVHLGIRQTRAKAGNKQERRQLQRMQLECQFQRTHFSSMRAAVEHLLRRLPLIATKDSRAGAFSFVQHSVSDFEALPPLKQRACEWLRAKCIERCMQQHADLKRLQADAKEELWSAREVAMFARYHAYTPSLKAKILEADAGEAANTQHFSAFVKSELQNVATPLAFETLTAQTHITDWVNEKWQMLQRHEVATCESEIIDVCIEDKQAAADAGTTQSARTNSLHQFNATDAAHPPRLLLPPPKRLQHANTLLGQVCKELGLELQAEQISEGVVHAAAQTVLAQCLQRFVEKLLRRTIATKLQQSPASEADLHILPADLGKVLNQERNRGSHEFALLTNRHCGVAKCKEEDVQKLSN